jgi:hypothetical protein
MSLMLMITMVKDLLAMSEGFGWQRYKKYLYQSLSCQEIALPYTPRKQYVSTHLTNIDLWSLG